ncbi:MAG: response regulator transcription factor [Mariprofundaceae bacterium]|nr:response regulator transcription factor [Mariprofundaceae bacterium]
MRHILIVDDEPVIRQMLADISTALFPAAKLYPAATLQQANKQLAEHPDLALIDLRLPDGNGATLIAPLKKQGCYCVVVTSFDDDRCLFGALRAGADGYLMKDQSKQALQKMLSGMMQGTPPISPAVAQRMLAYFHQQAPLEDAPNMSPRELEVLTWVAQGYTVQQAAETLGISKHTANDYMKSIYRKLNISCRAEAVSKAFEMGLIQHK